MSVSRLRAVVLAAGRGMRMRPLSDTLPKPLLPLRGRPVAAHTLRQLAAAGCEAAALNLHHLADEVRRRFGESFAGLRIHYSLEDRLLGTLGALTPLRGFLEPADLILVVNGDSICRWPLKRLVRRHLASAAEATLLVSRRAAPAEFGGGIGLDSKGQVVSVRPGASWGEVARRRVFAGAQVLSPAILGRLEQGPRDFVAHLWEPLLGEGARLASLETARRWHDLGTPRRYLEAARHWSPSRLPGAWVRRGWISPGARVSPQSRVRRSVLEGGSEAASEVEIDGSLLLPGARIASSSRALDSIFGPGVELPRGTTVEHRMVTVARAAAPLREQDSIMGGLVYSPLDGP